MLIWLYALVSVLIVSIISFIGIFTLSFKKDVLQKLLFLLVSFAVGGLFGDAFIHLIPQAFEDSNSKLTVSLYIILGIFIFFIVERFLRWRHCHTAAVEHHHPIVALNLVGDGVHNLIDGLIIGASYMVSIPIGISTTLAVILHEIPQEMGDFGILVHGGLSTRKALLFNFLSALTAVVGALISFIIGVHIKGYVSVLVPITAGGFIYIAGSGLIPELQHRCDIKVSTSLWQFVMIIFGVGIMALLTLLG